MFHHSSCRFGADAITGSTLETPEQLAHKYRHPHPHQRQREREERLHQADIAREAAEVGYLSFGDPLLVGFLVCTAADGNASAVASGIAALGGWP